MKTLDQIIARCSTPSNCLDGRDYTRLADFIPIDRLEEAGFKLADGVDPKELIVEELTEANVLKRLERDLDFAFSKALGKRGISAGLMYEVIKCWLWVLDHPLADFPDDGYAQYGLPLLKATAVAFNLPNPIGDDAGNEYQYSAESDY